MTPESVMMMGTEAMKVALALAAPLLLVALVTGLIISILQAATQINEMTLSVPTLKASEVGVRPPVNPEELEDLVNLVLLTAYERAEVVHEGLELAVSVLELLHLNF